jgi:uncharacterized membrane protein YoaT (DUF817 family)
MRCSNVNALVGNIHQQILNRLDVNSAATQVPQWWRELLSFGYKNAISCIFPVFIFLMLAVSRIFDHSVIPRYDFLLLVCILAQVLLFHSGIESKREVAVIFIFHALGVLLELHKVNVGSWSYPEEAYSKIAGVPLYSGFMYSSVASYICRAWANFDLSITHWPHPVWVVGVGIAIYANFFTNAYLPDIRWYVIPALFPIFWKSTVHFNTFGVVRKMPLLLSFVLIGFFIWLAENIATFFGAWKYAYQHEGWQAVEISKLTSWSLLVIVSVIIVGEMKRFGNRERKRL